jgi:hypothetical protein
VKSNQTAFYSNILSFLRSADHLIPEIIELSKWVSPSWKVTEESLWKLEQCVNRGSEMENTEELFTIPNDFIKEAFRDLSALKNPVAMDLFDRLAKTCIATYANGEDMFLWAKSVKERPGGSAVIVLHVSNLERFREIVERHDLVDNDTDLHILEEGIQFQS